MIKEIFAHTDHAKTTIMRLLPANQGLPPDVVPEYRPIHGCYRNTCKTTYNLLHHEVMKITVSQLKAKHLHFLKTFLFIVYTASDQSHCHLKISAHWKYMEAKIYIFSQRNIKAGQQNRGIKSSAFLIILWRWNIHQLQAAITLSTQSPPSSNLNLYWFWVVSVVVLVREGCISSQKNRWWMECITLIFWTGFAEFFHMWLQCVCAWQYPLSQGMKG